MKPVDFKDKNVVLVAPGCGNLPALETKDGWVVSCWEMSETEKKEFAKTGKVWLTVRGKSQPPVCMSAEKPYEMMEEESK